VCHLVLVAAEDRRQAGIVGRDQRRPRVEMQLVPFVYARPRVVGGADLLQFLAGHQFAKAE
jgi:hypothetical protein